MERSSLRDLLRVSKDLEEKTRSNEGLAFNLLHLGEELQQTVNNMKTFQDTLINIRGSDHQRHLPQIEEAYLQQLQRDNAELRSSLQEHKDALEIIMSTYRQQVCALMKGAPNKEVESKSTEQELFHTQQRMFEMAHVMSEAASTTDREVYHLQERVSQLEFENRNLRELLYLADQMVLEPYAGENGPLTVDKDKKIDEDPLLSLSSSRSSKSLTDSLSSPTQMDGHLSTLNSTDGPSLLEGLDKTPTGSEVNISWPLSEEIPVLPKPSSLPPQSSSSLSPSGQPDQDEVARALQQMDEIFQPWLDEDLDGDSPNEEESGVLEDSRLGKNSTLNCTVRTQPQSSALSPVAVDDI
jgi:suppressor of IKK-epsilon